MFTSFVFVCKVENYKLETTNINLGQKLTSSVLLRVYYIHGYQFS